MADDGTRIFGNDGWDDNRTDEEETAASRKGGGPLREEGMSRCGVLRQGRTNRLRENSFELEEVSSGGNGLLGERAWLKGFY